MEMMKALRMTLRHDWSRTIPLFDLGKIIPNHVRFSNWQLGFGKTKSSSYELPIVECKSLDTTIKSKYCAVHPLFMEYFFHSLYAI